MESFEVNDRFIAIYDGLLYAMEFKSQAELARLIGVSPQTLCEIFKKRQGITLEFVQKLCNYFRQINVEFLLFGKGKMWNSLNDFATPFEDHLKIKLEEKDNKIEQLIEEKTKGDNSELWKLIREQSKTIEELSKEVGRLNGLLQNQGQQKKSFAGTPPLAAKSKLK